MIQFCTLPVPEEGVEYTLTFWGWDQGWGSLEGSVMAYAVNISGSEALLAAINVPERQEDEEARPKNNVQWLRYRILLSETEAASMSKIRLYYHVGDSREDGGGEHSLNLRDVWFRPTIEDAGDPPSRMCSKSLYVASVVSAALCVVAMFVVFVFMGIKQSGLFTTRVASWSRVRIMWKMMVTTAFFLVTFSSFAEFTKQYPGPRCKNDAYFMIPIVFGCLGSAGALLVVVILIRGERESYPQEAQEPDDGRAAAEAARFEAGVRTTLEERLARVPPTSFASITATTEPVLPNRNSRLRLRAAREVDDTCAICLANMAGDDNMRQFPACQHCYHADCLEEWFRRSHLCPLCKRSVFIEGNKITVAVSASPASRGLRGLRGWLAGGSRGPAAARAASAIPEPTALTPRDIFGDYAPQSEQWLARESRRPAASRAASAMSEPELPQLAPRVIERPGDRPLTWASEAPRSPPRPVAAQYQEDGL
jgi:hypothetical protein